VLFQKDIRYTIPTFQRPYVWSQEDQWEPLWEDVRNLAEDYLDALDRCGSDSVKAEQETKAHFLGAVVLQQVHTSAKEIEQREVIDGQQRVTTIQLLLDAIQEICEEAPFRGPATRLSKLVTNDEDLIGDENHYKFKLWPTRGDREAFTHAMDNGLAVNDFENSLIVQAHEFFQEQIRKWLDVDDEQKESRVDALETAVTVLLQMVVIDLDHDDDPNVIFETLNARGTPLEQSDLIKNFVLSHFTGNPAEGEVVWGDLDDNWWRQERRQGRLLRPQLDMLFNYWLAMRTGDDVPPARVFTVFQSYSEGLQLEALMSDIKRDLNNWRYFVDIERTPEEDMFFYRTNVMQVGVITPALLLLLLADNPVRNRAFQALESFLIRRMVCRQTTKDYNRLTLDLARRLREGGPEKSDEVVVEYLREQKADAREWPSDETVADNFRTSRVYRLLTRGRLRLVLEGIESRLRSRSGKSEQPEVPRNLTIEHLMPVSWGTNWPLPNGTNPTIDAERRNRMVHTIGNLTLVNQRLNSTLSNGPWNVKRNELMKFSVMNLNSELSDEQHWDEDTILVRSNRMSQMFVEHWPGPKSTHWD